jgi:hypothetical protein
MKLLTEELRRQLLANGAANAAHVRRDGNTEGFKPVVKLFAPWGGATWLLTELDPSNPDIAFGLCDLGLGCAELGSVSLAEIEAVRGPGGLRIERDLYFKPDKTIRAYAEQAEREQRITA